MAKGPGPDPLKAMGCHRVLRHYFYMKLNHWGVEYPKRWEERAMADGG
ncbi:MAG: hypothetical protein RLY86_2604, partial [Pseudomonadota bacterium]